jgi:thiaminase/transcriptional activator TenA
MFDLYAATNKGFSMKFSEYLWQATLPTYQQILQHPFNTELAEGTLDKKCFIFYMAQDAYYLISFSRALAFIAGRAVSSKTIHQFLSFSLGALVAERELHASFLPSNYNCDRVEPSPSCMAYTQYLIATAATAPLEEAIAAVLPCFWIYREVGRNIAAHCMHDNPYMRWIETYSSQEFSDGTDQAISLLDNLAGQSSTEALEGMKKAFEYSSLFEWHFWNDAYKMIVFRDSLTKTSELLIKS